MFYTCEKMKSVCRNFVKDMTISQLCRIMAIRGINADSLTVSKIVEVVISDEYADILLDMACDVGWNDKDICRCSCEVTDDIHFDMFWRVAGPQPTDKIVHLIGDIAKSGYLKPLQVICDDLQIAISVW